MIADYHQQRTWSDKFIPKQISILNSYLKGNEVFSVSSVVQDAKQNTDAIGNCGTRVSLRVRKIYVVERGWAGQFTIRSVNGGSSTELDKLVWPDFMLYCIAGPESSRTENKTDDTLYQWFIGDMDVFRGYLRISDKSRRQTIMNNDGKTGFLPFRIDSIGGSNGKSFVVADSHTGYFVAKKRTNMTSTNKRLSAMRARIPVPPGHIRPLTDHDCICTTYPITEQAPNRSKWVVCSRCKRWKPKG